jgi:hypothetical protein
MTDWLKKAWGWLKSIPSESNGTGSASRIALLMIAATVCGVLIAHVWIHRTLPDKDTLEGLAALCSVGMGSYGLNKFANRGQDTGQSTGVGSDKG